MYQRAEAVETDTVLLFVESCTSMAPTEANVSLIKSTASLMRVALEGDDLKPLRDLVARATEWCQNISDVLAAAGHHLIEMLGNVPLTNLHDLIERVAEIERAVLPVSTAGMRLEGFGAQAVVG